MIGVTMTHLDERIYALLWLLSDDTGIVRIRVNDMANILRCHRNSVIRGTDRLAAVGRIEKYGRGPDGAEYKVPKQ